MRIPLLLAAAGAAWLFASPALAWVVFDTPPADEPPPAVTLSPQEPAAPPNPKFASDCPMGRPAAADARLAPFPAATTLVAAGNDSVPSGEAGRSIHQADPALRAAARSAVRISMCYVTPDGLPRALNTGAGEVMLDSAHLSNCSGILVPGNRVLLPLYCIEEPRLLAAGFRAARAQIAVGFTDPDAEPLLYDLDLESVRTDAATGAAMVTVLGDVMAAVGGHGPAAMAGDLDDFHPLVMLHFPLGQPMRLTDACLELPQPEDEQAGFFRHSCPSAVGSGGALLLDARTLALRGMHHSRNGTGDRRAVDIHALDAAFGLGLGAD